MANFWRSWFGEKPQGREAVRNEVLSLSERAPIPLLWLFGKTGSGKTSIIRYLTGADDALIGSGFRPETKASRRYDFPTSEEPLLSFLDTRGLGEASYDPQADIEQHSRSTQVILVTVRLTDHALDSVIEPLRKIRSSTPDRRVLLIVTCLHQADPSVVYQSRRDPFLPASNNNQPVALPPRVEALLAEKKKQFLGLYDVFIPVDLTHPDDHFEDPSFGGERLKAEIVSALPYAYRQSFIALSTGRNGTTSSRQQRARWQVLASSSLAATAGAVPIPWVDIPAVLAIQTHMAYKVAEIYQQEITPANWATLTGAAGGQIAMRLALREALKFIPFVGVAVGATSSFAFTYALGMSWDWYFATIRHGNVPSVEQLREVFDQQLKQGRKLWGLSSE